MTSRPSFRTALLAGVLGFTLLAGGAFGQSLQKGREALVKGDLRTAQIEFRNAVRNDPASAEARAALAQVSLDLGDGDTAEKEARAAIDRGFDKVAGTRMLLRGMLMQNRAREVLREFPIPAGAGPDPLGAQIAAAHAFAQLNLNDREAARKAAAEALRLNPKALEPHLAAAAIGFSEGNRQAAEAAIDQALVIDSNSVDALLRKAGLQFERGEADAAAATLGHLLKTAPAHVPAHILRAEALLRAGKPAEAKTEVDAALRLQPNSAPAAYLRAAMLVQAQDWKPADEIFQRLGSALASFPDGFLLQAIAKRGLNQIELAVDAAQRFVARRPEDPRGAKFLAAIEIERGRPGEATIVLNRFISRGTPDAEIYDLLGRAYAADNRPRESTVALQRASELAPKNAQILARLAASRLAAGDNAGSTQAAEGVLALVPDQPGARQMLAVAALGRGDIATAETELAKLDATVKSGEVGSTLSAAIKLARLDLAGAKIDFEAALKANADSVAARLGLARVAAADGRTADVDRLLAEVLQRDPGNAEAIGNIAGIAGINSPRGQAARQLLERSQAARPTDPRLAVALANLYNAAGEPNRALSILDTEALRRAGLGPSLPLARAQAYAAANRWSDAEIASRAALAESPDNIFARRQLAALLLRNSDPAGAEGLVREGLRTQPGSAALQRTLVTLVQQIRGLDAALGVADELAKQTNMQPNARLLRGELLMSAQRPVDAARAFTTAYNEAPSAQLALARATAFRTAGQTNDANGALNAWLQREPRNPEVLDALSQLDIQAGRLPDAERKLNVVLESAPNNGVALNNLAWILGERGGASMPKARELAQRAYFLMPSAESADTLGWILTRDGNAPLALPLLRAAATPRGRQAPNPSIVYHLAYALKETGDKPEAQRLLETLLVANTGFPERAEAEKLLNALKAGN